MKLTWQKWEGWSILAIIFITLFILETLFLVYSYGLGAEIVENEKECIAICNENYARQPVNSSGSYDLDQGICYCYINGAVSLTKALE